MCQPLDVAILCALFLWLLRLVNFHGGPQKKVGVIQQDFPSNLIPTLPPLFCFYYISKIITSVARHFFLVLTSQQYSYPAIPARYFIATLFSLEGCFVAGRAQLHRQHTRRVSRNYHRYHHHHHHHYLLLRQPLLLLLLLLLLSRVHQSFIESSSQVDSTSC